VRFFKSFLRGLWAVGCDRGVIGASIFDPKKYPQEFCNPWGLPEF